MSSQPADMSSLLGSYLDPERVAHSQGVADTAEELAQLHAPELVGYARLAGLLHDNAKALPPAELLQRAEELGIEVSAVERSNPALLHGKVGARLLPERFGIDDSQVADAIVDHVTGRAGMGKLSRILYVADQAAPDRSFNGVAELRTLMRDDLEAAVRLVARRKIEHTVKRGQLLAPDTVALYNELTEQLEGRRGQQ